MTNLFLSEIKRRTCGLAVIFLALLPIKSAYTQIAPAGSIYFQQPSGVHYFFASDGVQAGGSFYYVNYQTSQYDVIAPINVSSNGAFSGTSSVTGLTVSGTINANTITLNYKGVSISPTKEAPYGPTQRFAGGFIGSVTNPSLGIGLATVFSTGHGVCFIFAANNSGISVGVGTIDASGNLSATTIAGEHFTTQFNPVNGLAQGTFQSSFGYTYTYAVVRVTAPQLANISTRGFVGSGEQVLIGGFIVSEGGKNVLITAKGPSLANKVTNPVQNPRLDLHLGSQIIASNASWKANANAADIAASGAGPTDDREAALLVTLEPGVYTVVVSSEDSSQGIGIVEVYGN